MGQVERVTNLNDYDFYFFFKLLNCLFVEYFVYLLSFNLILLLFGLFLLLFGLLFIVIQDFYFLFKRLMIMFGAVLPIPYCIGRYIPYQLMHQYRYTPYFVPKKILAVPANSSRTGRNTKFFFFLCVCVCNCGSFLRAGW